jgi:hypothetical protein
MNAEAAQKQGQQNADNFIAADGLVLLIKNRLRGGIRLAAHDWFSLLHPQDTQPAARRFLLAEFSKCAWECGRAEFRGEAI